MNNRIESWKMALVAAVVAALAGCGAAVGSESDAGHGDGAAEASTVCHFTDGRTCALGMSCPAGDGCNQCVCQANGSLACTELACADAGPQSDAGSCVGLGDPCTTEAQCCGAFCQIPPGASVGSCVAPTPPQNFFACGPSLRCDSAAQYCQRTLSDVSGVPDDFACVTFPDTCRTARNCGCLAEGGGACPGGCTTTPDGGVEVTCPGG